MRYIQAIKDFLEERNENYNVSGIIAAPDIENDATSALRFIQDTVKFYKLYLNIDSEPANYVRCKELQRFKDDLQKFSLIIEQFNPEEVIQIETYTQGRDMEEGE